MFWPGRELPLCGRARSARFRISRPPEGGSPARVSDPVLSSQLLEQGVAAGNLDLAGRFLDIELLHHAVLDQHGIALRARAEPIARAVEGQIDGLGEFTVAIGEELDLV